MATDHDPIAIAVLRVVGRGEPLELPRYQTDGSAGMDLRADEPVELAPGERRLVPTGIAVAIPPGFEGQVRPRSGLALRHGLGIPNAPGTIDSDYRGEVGVILVNWGAETVRLPRGERIAQLVVAPVRRATLHEVSELPGSDRGGGGFGSTGRSGGHPREAPMIPRYTRPEMARIWSPERRFRIWLDVELLAAEAMAKLGEVPAEDLASLRRAFDGFEFSAADVARIDEIEKVTKHDVIAFLTFVEEKGGLPARHLHKGMTSSDVLDTTLAVQLREATALLLADVDRVRAAVRKRAFEHRRTPMIGRSHGIHAEPVTFGLKLAGWYDAWGRRRAALEAAGKVAAVGKISGAVGTFANVDPRVEAFVMERLGLEGGEGAATQVVARDRHADLFCAMAVAGATLEQQATEIRHLQRTEVREAEEPFTAGQKGSSAMPHKRNPILSENLTGMARLLRGWAVPALENVALWHERDISHSSVERVIGPDATIALDFSLVRFARMIEDLRVYPERMQENLEQTGGLFEAQRVLLALVGKGIPRQEGYVLVQRNAMKVWEERVDFRTALKGDADVRKALSDAEIDACFAVDYHLKHVDTIFRRVFGEAAE